MISEVLTGAGLLGRGAKIILKRPKLFLLGALPAVITSVIFLILLIVLLFRVDEIVLWLSPFADGWDAGWAMTVRILMGVALIAGSILLMVISFSALTLALGAPLYDQISEAVDASEGDAPPPREEPLGTQIGRAVRQAIALILVSLVGAIVLFAIGLVPVVGNVVGAVLSALFGGWMLATELIGSACERRGIITLAGRRAAMRTARAKVFGLGVPTFLLLSVPLVAIVVFPIATAAGTLLARELLPAEEKLR
ncbi:EI24 domain-containing protein [Microlunatus parietis]|uniref:CysZ protein n=1 Tax=Microlunatus parietis TaxID=682979 RepID=A0A7Y9IBW5_9ACTN|nr:EI24 domain-containing protein [Microlunatus parietis]NYE73837.1 CysZ protein [Microlunatus parietis]